jgi:transcriptional regulator with XRE-family HTH domain
MPVEDLSSPTVRRRRLAAELRAIREGMGRSGDAVANALKWSPSKISRYERAKTSLPPREVERLLDYYKITGDRRRMLLDLAQDATAKGWWEEQEYANTIGEDYRQFIGLEHEASSMAVWHVDVVPGLLQTEGYARRIISSYSRVEPVAPGAIGRLVRVRMRRQQVLQRSALHIEVVLDESVLMRKIGSADIMREQLQYLVSIADQPNVDLRILPLVADHTIVGESFVVFGFGTEEEDAILQDVVATEQMRSGFILEGERETYLHRLAFSMLAAASLGTTESKERILKAADEWAAQSPQLA